MTPFDLEREIAPWRRELEATLAFSAGELDELEDHLRLDFQARVKKGTAPETAWRAARDNLGPASALAPEFAKDKLMPALGRLLLAWWRPALLVAAFILMFRAVFGVGQLAPGGSAAFWGFAALAFGLVLLFLRQKSQRLALILGIGNAICLLPLLHLLVYNPFVGRFVGPGWAEMAGDFGPAPILLGALGWLGLNFWTAARVRLQPGERPLVVALAGALIFLLALAPFAGEVIGNLALRNIYDLPDPHAVHYTGDALVQYNNWIFVGTLVKAEVFIGHAVPIALLLIFCGGVFALKFIAGPESATSGERQIAFPAPQDLPWILALAGTGFFWVFCHLAESAMDNSLAELQPKIFYAARLHGGFEAMVVAMAALFLVGSFEITRRLRCASSVRPFYAYLVVVIEMAVLVALIGLPRFFQETQYDPARIDISLEPAWLSALFCFAVFALAVRQVSFIRKSVRSGASAISLWKFDGRSLVEFGLQLGIAIACAGLIFYLVAYILAEISTIYIHALLDWSAAAHDPATHAFHPQDDVGYNPLFNWALAGPGTLSLFLTAGLTIAIILSALEFVRFNAFRFYRLRRARVATPPAVALNE